jgi:polyisoprenoid-binding protein YceI
VTAKCPMVRSREADTNTVSDSAVRAFARRTTGAALLVATVVGAGALQGRVQAQDRVPVRYGLVAERSEVRYRVREQLVGLSFPNDAVGATSAVEGGVAFDGQGRVRPADSRFTVDLRMLRSDEARRDNYIRRNTLETERYPTVTFVPTEARRLPFPLPTSGSVSFELLGDLTVKDATRPVTWAATATFDGPQVSIRARTAFRFGDFGLRAPRVSVVLGVEDDIKLEADLVLRRGG